MFFSLEVNGKPYLVGRMGESRAIQLGNYKYYLKKYEGWDYNFNFGAVVYGVVRYKPAEYYQLYMPDPVEEIRYFIEGENYPRNNFTIALKELLSHES